MESKRQSRPCDLFPGLTCFDQAECAGSGCIIDRQSSSYDGDPYMPNFQDSDENGTGPESDHTLT